MFFTASLAILLLGEIKIKKGCWSVVGCPIVNRQEMGSVKKSINNLNEEVVSWVAGKSMVLEKIEIKAGNYGGVLRKISCRISGPNSEEIAPVRESAAFTSSSGEGWRGINYADLDAKIIEGQKYEIRCKGQDSWNSMYWLYDLSLGKTFRVYACQGTEASPTPMVTIKPTPTGTVELPIENKRIKIAHFSDIGGDDPNKIFGLLKKYEGERVVFLGSGDYVVYSELTDLAKVKKAVDNFVDQSSFKNEDIILALGNHDDPGRVGTWKWNQTWADSRKAEGVVIKDSLIIAWLHTEKPDLVMVETEIAKKRVACPNCVAVMIGHKPVVMETGMETYQNYLLPTAWREQVLTILKKYNFKLYLTGHFEVHSTINNDGVIHNRATPARSGFEEISFETGEGGEIKNVKVTTMNYSFIGNTNQLPTPSTGMRLTPTTTPKPTVELINSCHKECSSTEQCQNGQICTRNYNVRPDGVKICLNWYCSTETDCVCAWQK